MTCILARGKRRGFSPGAAVRHRGRTRAPADGASEIFIFHFSWNWTSLFPDIGHDDFSHFFLKSDFTIEVQSQIQETSDFRKSGGKKGKKNTLKSVGSGVLFWRFENVRFFLIWPDSAAKPVLNPGYFTTGKRFENVFSNMSSVRKWILFKGHANGNFSIREVLSPEITHIDITPNTKNLAHKKIYNLAHKQTPVCQFVEWSCCSVVTWQSVTCLYIGGLIVKSVLYGYRTNGYISVDYCDPLSKDLF